VKPGQRSKPRARVTYHELRHTSATMMLTAGKSLPVVARQLGHASSQITAMVYEHLLDDALLDDALEAFSEAFESPHTPARTPAPDHLDSEDGPEPA
jgi:integrase